MSELVAATTVVETDITFGLLWETASFMEVDSVE